MRKTTILVLVMTAVGLSIYDIIAEARDGEKSTISDVITEASKQQPIIAATFGVLMGHWFWK